MVAAANAGANKTDRDNDDDDDDNGEATRDSSDVQRARSYEENARVKERNDEEAVGGRKE